MPLKKPPTKRRRWIGVLLVFLALLAAAWGTGGLHSLAHLYVRQALSDGHDQLAGSRLSLASWMGESSETTFLQARLARHRGQYDRMLKLLDQAHRLGYPTEQLALETLLAQSETGQFDDEAVSRLNGWLLDPSVDVREVSAAYANGLAATGRFAEARQVLGAWAADFPQDARPVYRLGRIHEHERNKTSAIETYRQALQRQRTYIPAIYALGRLLLDQRQLDEAINVLQTCPDADNVLPVQVVMGMCKKAQAEPVQARQFFERVLSHSPAEIEAAYRAVNEPSERLTVAAELGKLESDEGNYAAAKQWLEKAIAHNPRDTQSRYAYAVALRGLGEKQKAEEELAYVKQATEALAGVNVFWDRIGSNPADVEARLELAKILLEHESVRNGLFWLRSVEAYDPGNAQAKELIERYAKQP